MNSEAGNIVLNTILQDYDSNLQLTAIQELVFHQSWERKSYKDIAAESGYEHDYIRQVGSQLWQLLSKATSKRVTKQNFHTILKQYQQLQQEATSIQDWGEAVNVSAFWGRQPALATLKQWIIKDNCSFVAILGIGGVGKTALSVKFAQQVQDEFTYIIWRSIRDAPPIVELLADIIKILSNQQEIELPDTVAGCLSLLIKHLQQHRCLIVIDNFETILQKGEEFGYYQPGYEGYGELLKRVGEIAHQSCLIITTREKPEEVAALEGEFLPVRVLQLPGIAPTAGKQLLKAKGLTVTEADTQQLVETYSGNPLALKIAATAIKDLFAGDIANFLTQETTLFRGIRKLLEQQFKRLSPLEQHLMYWLAINREPVIASELQADIFPPTSEASILKALKVLQRRCLVEKNDTGYTQQSVVMEFMTERLIEQVCQEIITAELSLLNSHALIKAQGKYYIRESQIRLILKPLITKLSSQYRNIQTIADQLSLILCKLRDQKVTSGYAGGNIINLLCQLPIELTGADFSNLPVWQAYLPNVKLHAVNFAHADLSQSVFLETLGSVLSVAISPDGRLVAAGDTNGEVRVWQVSDGKQLLNLPRCSSWIWSVAFSPDSRILASVDDNVVKLWDSHTGKCLKTLDGHLSWLYDVAFSCDRKTLASASCDHTVKLWDIETGKCLHTLTGHQDVVYSVAFSPDGQILASGSNDQMIRIWDVNTGKCLKTLEGNPGWIWRVAFSPASTLTKGGQGGVLASGSHDYQIRIWDIFTGECLQTLQGHRNWVLSVAFSSNGRTLASSSEDGTVRLWNLTTGKCLRVLQGHSNRVCSVAFTPNGQTLASGSLDSTVQLWDVRTGQCRKILRGYTNLVWSVTFSPDGKILASGNEDGMVRLWDIATGECSQALAGHTSRVWSVAFSRDGEILASSSDDRTIRLRHVSTGECLRSWEAYPNWVHSVAFSRDGQILASGGGESAIKLWDVTTAECVQILTGHAGWIRSVKFSPDGQFLASGSVDNTVKLWDVSTGQCLQTLEGGEGFISEVAFSPSGEVIANSCSDGTVKVWDTQTGKCLNTLQGHTNRVWSVAFSPQGHILASGGADWQVKLWDLSTGECYQTFQAHDNRVQSVAFHPDGKILASASHDGMIKLWNIEPREFWKTLQVPRPYEGMNITQVKGLTPAQKATLQTLGALD